LVQAVKITFKKAFDPTVVLSAAKVALVVGPIITLVNQWDYLLAGQLDILKAILSFLIPYTVSTVSFLLAYSKLEEPPEEPAIVADYDTVNLAELNKRLDALVVILGQKHNQRQLEALSYKRSLSVTDKPVDLLSELRYLQAAFQSLQ